MLCSVLVFYVTMKRFLSQESPESTSKDAIKKPKPQPNRKYDETYLQFGFIIKPGTENSDNPIPQCVICLETLSNQSMKPSLLKRHQSTKHTELVGKPIEFFQRKSVICKKGSTCMTNFVNTDTNLIKASYLASFRIAKEGKPHTIGETLLLPAARDMVQAVLGEKSAKEIQKVPLSNNTVKRRIDDMSSNIEETLALQLQECTYFALQIDESTDVTNMAQLLVFVRYDYHEEIKEEFLFCKPLESNTKAENIFSVIDNYLSKIGVPWKKCVGICTDGAKAMYGHLTGLAAKVKKVARKCKRTHCVIHREALASKDMPESLHTVLKDAVKVINFIKARALNSRIFTLLCEDMGGKFKTLLLHTEVRWLSRGKILTRIFELRSEVFMFLSEKNNEMKNFFSDDKWLSRLAYLADIFDRLNILNMGLQGPSTTAFSANDKILSFKRKLTLFSSQAVNNDFSSFPTLASFLEDNELTPMEDLVPDIIEHLELLKNSFEKYFPDDFTKYDWIRNPFSEKVAQAQEVTAKEAFIEMTSDSSMKDAFKSKPLHSFWMGTKSEYPSLFQQAVRFLIPFVTTYMCESGFSELLYTKNKYRNRLSVEEDLRVKLSTIQPDFEALIENKQQHVFN